MHGVVFRDAERARQNLARVAECAPAGVLGPLPNLLAESPDADSALNGFERLCSTAAPDLLALLERHPFLVHYALTVFGFSPYLGDTLLQNPDLFQMLLRDKGFGRSHGVDDFRESLARFRSRSLDADLSLLLARFKRREYVRIMLRDVLGISTLAETTSEISALSDVLIAEALREAQHQLRARFGAPRLQDAAGRWIEPAVAVLSLGKLGGNELNYSSDVDLLFLYGDAGVAEGGGAISNREYFIRLAQQVTEILSRVTGEGPVFRIDLRLRPQGGEGEPAVGLRHALDYYTRVAHDWELQALIKARHSAGDLELTREFLRGIEPLVYVGAQPDASPAGPVQQRLNFPAIETALASRQKISDKRRPRSAAGGLDVKLDRGGIRDIEFLVQCLQRVYGGAEPWLRSGGTLFSLQKLHDKGHLSGKDFHELSNAYEFLRQIEHRLQLRRGQQTHRLPDAEEDLVVLGRSLGGDPGQSRSPDQIAAAVRDRMAAVAEIYNRIIHRQQVQQTRVVAPEKGFRLRGTQAEIGSDHSYQQMLERLAADSPALHALASRPDLSTLARRNLHRFFSSAFTGSERYAAVARHPDAVERALLLFEVSEFLTDVLVRHPEEVALLEGMPRKLGWRPAALFGGVPLASAEGHDAVLEYLGAAALPYGEKLALLRERYRQRVFASSARDLAELRNVYDSLADASDAADAAIRAALAVADAPPGMVVMALGRLGTHEFDVGSDADLLFLRDENTAPADATRAAERLTETLAAYTREGTVFAVDSRLRPHGGEGELVITPAQLAAYFGGEAQPWEALTYSKLRYVAGSRDLGDAALGAVRSHLPRFRDDAGLAASLVAMRTRLERESGGDNFKTQAGGFYDVDFICGYLLVRQGQEQPRGNVRQTLDELRRRRALPQNDCTVLDRAAELLRAVEHVVRLVQGRARKSLPAAEHARQTVERLTSQILNRQFVKGLEAEMAQERTRVRKVFERVMK
ncbi:MAG TPA: hypothetical protein VFA60_04210 [Terriglobales bacterium]|nr:hypothetical protein [Terriglobales bacterium]